MVIDTFEFWTHLKVELSDTGVLSWRQLLKFEAPLAAVRSCTLRARTFTGLYELEFVADESGRSRLRRLTALPGDPAFDRLVAMLRQRLAPGVPFVDEIFVPLTDPQRLRSYDLGARVMGRTLPRWGFLLLLYLLSFMIVPLLLAIWIQASGRYRLKTDGAGLTVVRLLTRRIAWPDLRHVESQRIMQYQNGVRTGMKLRLRLHHARGDLTVYMNPVLGEALLRELAARSIAISRST
ncbi:MAG TPA: hypothetical protein VHV51_12170 [Polyangiaceae bacterium]|nr:hypothetical protein [Polyangiaceae bacterium]